MLRVCVTEAYLVRLNTTLFSVQRRTIEKQSCTRKNLAGVDVVVVMAMGVKNACRVLMVASVNSKTVSRSSTTRTYSGKGMAERVCR